MNQQKRTYLKLIDEARRKEDIGWKEARNRVRNYDKERLEKAGLKEGYAEQPRDLEYKIETEEDRISNRVQTLSEDVELLHHAGFWRPHWQELLNVDGDEEVNFILGEDMLDCESPQEEFGRELGEMTDRLFAIFPSPEQVHPHDFRYGLIRGFVSGFFQSTVSDVDELPVNNQLYELPELVENDIERVEEEVKQTDSGLAGFFSGSTIPKWFIELDKEVDEHIGRVLQFLDYEKTDTLIRYVRTELQNEYFHGANLSAIIAMEYPHHDDGEGLSLRHRRAESAVSSEYVTSDRVKKIVEERYLVTVSEMDERVSDDLDRLFAPDDLIPPKMVLNIPHAPETSDAVAVDRVSVKTGVDKSDAARYAQYLAGDDVEWIDSWDSNAVVSINERDEYFGDWRLSLTPYGRLIRKHTQQKHIEKAEVIKQEERHHYIQHARPWGSSHIVDVSNSLLSKVVEQMKNEDSE